MLSCFCLFLFLQTTELYQWDSSLVILFNTPAMGDHTFNPSTQKQKQMNFYKFQASKGYVVRPYFKKKKKEKKKSLIHIIM